MLGVAPCRLLPWDSEFFGAQIGRLIPTIPSPEEFLRAMVWCRAERIRCLYFLADPGDPGTLRHAESHGFELMDLRLTLETVNSHAAEAPPEIRPLREGDLDSLKGVVREAHTDSRFFADVRFSRERCGDLYELWLRRDSTDPDGDVFVADTGEGAVGYISVRSRGGVAEIGLLGVHPDARGRGLGRLLIRAALAWAGSKSLEVRVVTQGRNVPAQRLYQRAGFVTREVGLWYHRWFLD